MSFTGEKHQEQKILKLRSQVNSITGQDNIYSRPKGKINNLESQSKPHTT